MSILTKFESSVPSEQKSALSYGEAVFAVRHDVRVAEAAFARVAKSELQIKLSCRRSKRVDAIGDRRAVVWVAQESVTIHLRNLPEQPIEKSDGEVYVRELTQKIAEPILNYCEADDVIYLLGPLVPQVQQVGPEQFKFSLKQRWTLESACG
jgi:hypothetical protein